MLLDQMAGDIELLAAVVEAFVECRQDQLRALQEAYEGGDARALQAAAHTISGSLRNLCADSAAAIAAEIEAAAQAGFTQGHGLRVAELERRHPAIEAELLALVASSAAPRGLACGS